MQTVIPQLRVTDMAASLRFYVDGLGFIEDWRHQFEPGFPWFVSVGRGHEDGNQGCLHRNSLNDTWHSCVRRKLRKRL